MDRWKYFDITHRDHLICNPTSSEKLDELLGLLQLEPGSHILEMACGKGELLVRLVERFRCSAVGVDLSPYVIADAREKVAERIPDADVELIERHGAEYQSEPESFDVTVCLGASWIWDGHRGTLQALKGMTKPGGKIVVGEPFWKQEPSPEYLEADGLPRDMCDTHAGNVATGIDLGLTPLYALVSNADEWDRYEALQWRAAETWAFENPDDPDRDEVLERCRHARDVYLRWGRDTMGWAIYLFRV